MPHRRPLPLSPAALAFALVLGSAGLASAQAQQAPPPYQPAPYVAPLPTPEPPPKTEREGFLLGLSAGFGALDGGGTSTSTLNYHIEIGGFLHPNWAITVGFWGGQDNEEFGSTTNTNAGLMAQYWLSDAFWLKGGLGTASLSSEYDGLTYYDYNGMAIAGMGAWEFYQRSEYHFFASLSMTVQGYEDVSENITATALQIGVQYF